MTTTAVYFINSSITPVNAAAPETEHPNIAMLRTLLRALQHPEKANKLIEVLPPDLDRLELVDIVNAMCQLGFDGAPIALRARDIDPRLLPCLFVEAWSGRIRVITEPERRRVRGTAYIFTERSVADTQRQKEAQTVSGGWFRQLMVRFRPLFWKVASVGVAQSAVAICIPLFLMAIYDRLADLTTETTIFALGLGALLALIIQGQLRAMQSRTLAWFSARVDYIVGTAIFAQLLHLPAYAIERASVASQVSRLRVFESVSGFFASPLFLTLLDLPFSLIALGVIFAIGGPLGFIPVAAVAVYGLLAVIFAPRLRVAMFHAATSRADVQTHHVELFERLQMLRVNGMSEIWSEQFRDISAQGSLTAFRSQFLGHVLDALAQGVMLLGGLAVIYVGVERVWAGSITGGALFASFILSWRVMVPWRTLCGALPRLEQLRRSIQQIDRLMQLDTEAPAGKMLGKPGHVEGRLAFSKVGLRYTKDSDPVFVGLSFSLKSGEMLAIAGGNGTGKSTILKLILGLYRPQAGAITLDGRDIRQIDPTALRKELAYVPQIPELFDGTIADNIRLGNPLATDEEILAALDITDMAAEAASLPLGLDTPIKTGGESLPVSLTYRIGLARAYVRNSQVMLFDELPSAILNSDIGQRFIKRLRAWHGGKTIVMVTHRDDLLRMSDRAIGLLSGGRVVVGIPEEVMQRMREDTFAQIGRYA